MNDQTLKTANGCGGRSLGSDSNYSSCVIRKSRTWIWVIGILMATRSLCFCAGDLANTRDHLNNASAKKRNAVVNSMEMNNDRQHFRDLERMAKEDPDPYVRHNAIAVMSRLGDTDAKQELIDIATHASNEGDRQVAISAVPMLLSKEEALPVLKQALRDQDNVVRIRAAEHLGRYGDYSGEKILLDASKSKDQLIWGEAMRAIGYVNTPSVRKRLGELAIGTYSGHYAAKEAYRRLQYADASTDHQFEMAKEDISSIYLGIVYLGCEKLVHVGTPQSIQLLFTLANNPKQYDSFRAARDTLVGEKLIDKKHYWDQPLNPK